MYAYRHPRLRPDRQHPVRLRSFGLIASCKNDERGADAAGTSPADDRLEIRGKDGVG